ncbi:MAG TPA: Hpt domain-containing protein [Nocardioides sp.]|nr:Hpt domain-containing protein [Nocardioides sp.]
MVEPPVVFDATAVSSLTGHPDDRAFALVLVTRYRALLPERVRRIAVALAERETDDALDAVLSLKVASATVGARELAQIAERIERVLRLGDVNQAVLRGPELAAAVRRAHHALDAFLDGTPDD